MKTITLHLKVRENIYLQLLEHFSIEELKENLKDDALTELYDLYRAIMKQKLKAVRKEKAA